MRLFDVVFFLLSPLLLLVCYADDHVDGDKQNGANFHTIWSSNYSSTTINAYQWSYIKIELPPQFSSLSIALNTSVNLDQKSVAKQHKDTLPMICFREGGPPLPDASETALKDLVLDSFCNHSTEINFKTCYLLQTSIEITLTNEQIEEGTLYLGLFNGIGPVRTQSKMINRGAPYLFSSSISVGGCRNSTLCGQYCNNTLHELRCPAQIHHQTIPKRHLDHDTDKQVAARISTCKGSLASCHTQMKPNLFVLNVQRISEWLTISVNKTGTRVGNIVRCYAKHGAIPTTDSFHYFSDIMKAPLVIQSPKVGTWYFLFVPLTNSYSNTYQGAQEVANFCYSLRWEILGCSQGRAGPNCTWQIYKIEEDQENSSPYAIYINDTKLSSNGFPLEPLMSKPSSKDKEGYAWTYFLMDIQEDDSTKHINVRLVSNGTIEYEMYARIGGLPSVDKWDYYYYQANQSSSNSSRDGYLLKLYNTNEQNVNMYIFYPRNGLWVFGLRHLVSKIDSMSQTNMSISIEPCPNQCSGFGTCADSTKIDSLSFCKCDQRHGGFDCSVELVSKAEQKWHMIFLVASNAAALLPAFWTLRHKLFTEGVILASSGVFSAIYHACDADWKCALPFGVLQFMDFWLSFVAVVSIFVYLVDISEAAKGAVLTAVLILTAVVARDSPTRSSNIIYVVVIGVVCLLVGLLIDISTKYHSLSNICPRQSHNCCKPKEKLRKCFRWGYVLLGFTSLACAASSMWFENSENYWMWHSIWHIAVFTAASFFLCSKVQKNWLKPTIQCHFQPVPVQPPDSVS